MLVEDDGEFFGTMGTEHEDALDVSGAARTSDEGDHAGPTNWTVSMVKQFVSSWEIGHKLIQAGDDDMMRRQDGQGAATTGAGGEEHGSGLSDNGITPADTSIATLQFIDVISAIGGQYRQP